MKIESRMNEFEKVADKKPAADIQERMVDFEEVEKKNEYASSDKESTLPFGLKKYKTCPHCGEFMEIYKIESKEAIYFCKSCKQELRQKIELA